VLAKLPAYFQPPMTFAYLTGWRVPSEVLHLTWTRVDLGANVVRLEPGKPAAGGTKNREGRTFPFGALADLRTRLERQRATVDGVQRARGKVVPWVFCYPNGKPIRDYYNGLARGLPGGRGREAGRTRGGRAAGAPDGHPA